MYGITKRSIPSCTQGVADMPKDVLIKYEWTSDSRYSVRRVNVLVRPDELYLTTLDPGEFRESIEEIRDSDIERGLRAIGMLK